MATDPEYRDRKRALGRAYAKKHRAKPEYREAVQRELARRKGDGRGRVYFIQAASGPIKIGFTTKRVEVRLSELQVGSWEPLTLLATVVATEAGEAKLHRAFAAARIRAEWFSPVPKLLRLIDRLR